MDRSPLQGASLREDLRLHSRYIRDTLGPILAQQPKLSHSDIARLRSIFKELDSVPMTLDLLRFSRIEKAMMVIAATGNASWPLEIVVHAEELITKWEEELGPLKNLRADLYGPGGRLEGVRKVTTWRHGIYEKDGDSKSTWSVSGLPSPSRAHRSGHIGFEVGDWWLKPAAAYRDGIIDETSDSITADGNLAYAIVMTGNCETDLGRNDEIKYQASQTDPNLFKLARTMTSDTDKIVRVLRSWKLRSKWAPKAGLRYDGLYRVVAFSVKLPHADTWQCAFTLQRLRDSQPSLYTALNYPTSDQLDDFKDYQRLELVDQGDDSTMMRQMGTTRALLEAGVGAGDDAGAEDEGRRDSGYYSRRDSKVSVLSAGRKGSGQNFAEEEDDQDKDDHHDKGEKTTPKHREGGDRGVRPLTMVYEDTEDSGEDGDGEDDEEDEKRR